MNLKDLFHRTKTEPEGDAPEGFETDVLLVRENGEIRRVEPKESESDAPDA